MQKQQTAESSERIDSALYAMWRFHAWVHGAGSYNNIDALVASGEMRAFKCAARDCKCCYEHVDEWLVSTVSTVNEVTGGYV